VKTLIVKFILDEPVKGTASKIRGFVARQYDEYILLHHHLGQFLLFRYPLIQYKMIEGIPIIVGLNKGADILQKIYWDLNFFFIGDEKVQIREKILILRSDDYGSNSQFNDYYFLTPWLALNEKNYEKYQKLGTWERRKELLASILVGNIISMSKGLGYTVPEILKVEIKSIREMPVKLKDIPMLSFVGNFSVNFEIPDYWGIGKSVSRGFGTVKKCSS